MRTMIALLFCLTMLATTALASSEIYSFRPGPTYNGASRDELIASVQKFERMQAEARNRRLQYSLIALGGGIVFSIVVGVLVRNRRKIVDKSEGALVGVLASVVKTKRGLARKVNDRLRETSDI